MAQDLSPQETPRASMSDCPGAPPSVGFPQAPIPDAPLPVPPEADRRKQLLARLLNRVGIPTSPGTEWALDWLQVLVIAGLLAWLTMSYVIVRMQVPTGSMEPTIMPGDSFFVDKASYDLGLRHPKPGDIVVFWHYEDTPTCRDGFLNWRWGPLHGCWVRYVKRLIAVGGQTVQIKGDCKVTVNGAPLSGPAFDRCYEPRGRMGTDVWTVPADSYFALGDNTENSSDSRYWGFVRASDFIGEPFLRVWPPAKLGFMNAYWGSQP